MISPPPPPEQFLLVYTQPSAPNAQSTQINTVVSLNGTTWSLAQAVSDSGGTPLPAHRNAPPGLATDGRVYQVAWFDPSGQLNTRISSDGRNWTGGSTHGQPMPVDIQSRPTLATGGGLWIAAVRLSNKDILIQPLDGSSATPLTNGTTSLKSPESPALAYGNGKFVLAYVDTVGVLRMLESSDGKTWPSGPGTALPFPQGVTPPPPPAVGGMLGRIEGAPYLTFGTDNMFYLAAERVYSGPTLQNGQILIYRSTDGTSWTFANAIEQTTAHPSGLAIAGPATEQVIVEPVPFSGTAPDVFVAGSKIDPSPLTRVGSIVSSPVSLAHGPRRIDFRNGIIFFERFRRFPTPGLTAGRLTEDVTLEVVHNDSTGALVSRMDPWTVQNATLRQQHFWNQGHTTSPQFEGLLSPGDTVTISVTGDSGTVSKTLTQQGIVVTGSDCIGSSFDVDMPTQSFFYTIWRRCEVTPGSPPS